MIRVLIADDDSLVRRGLRAILGREKDVQVVGEARNGQEGVDLAERLTPDIVLMDVKMPIMDGLEATRQIRSRGNRPLVLILAMSCDDWIVQKALECGAEGYVTKKSMFGHLVPGIRAVQAGERYFSPDISEIMLQHGWS